MTTAIITTIFLGVMLASWSREVNEHGFWTGTGIVTAQVAVCGVVALIMGVFV